MNVEPYLDQIRLLMMKLKDLLRKQEMGNDASRVEVEVTSKNGSALVCTSYSDARAWLARR